MNNCKVKIGWAKWLEMAVGLFQAGAVIGGLVLGVNNIATQVKANQQMANSTQPTQPTQPQPPTNDVA